MKRFFSAALVLALLLTLTPAAIAAPEMPSITSAAAFVMDCDTGDILFAKNETTLRAPASTTKLMTAYLVLEAMAAGQFSEDTLVPVSEEAYAVATNPDLTNVVMKRDKSYAVADLMDAMLVVSACGASVSLAEVVAGTEAAFIQRMNTKLVELGIDGSFVDSHGLSSSNQISAQGLALLSQALIQDYPQVLDYTKQTAIQFDGIWYSCTNCLLPGCSAEYEGADGLKTGSTSAAGKCLVGTAVRDGRRIISVILGAPYSSTRATEMVALLDYGFASLKAGVSIPQEPQLPTMSTEPTQPEAPGGMLSPVTSNADAAQRLYALGLLRGQGYLPDGSPDLAINQSLNRAASVILLLRLLGLEQDALTSDAVAPFTDLDDWAWAEPYVALAYQQGLAAGIGNNEFGPGNDCDVRSYLTFLLRALGYVEGYDFQWSEALRFAQSIGMDGTAGLRATGSIDRGIAARLTFGALSCWMADGSQYLCDLLVAQGVLDAETAAAQGLPVSDWFHGVGDAA